VHDRQRRIAGELRDAADIAGGHQIGPGQGDAGQLAVAQCRRQFRLQQVVGAGRTAAQMTFRHIHDLETRGGEQRFGLAVDLLPMLQRTRGMVGDPQLRYRSAGILPALVPAGSRRSEV